MKVPSAHPRTSQEKELSHSGAEERLAEGEVHYVYDEACDPLNSGPWGHATHPQSSKGLTGHL